VNFITGEYGEGDGGRLAFWVGYCSPRLRHFAENAWKANRNANFNNGSVVDEDLKVCRGTTGLYVCDTSVMPISTAANPVLALAGLA
jgi:hypothetical protein